MKYDCDIILLSYENPELLSKCVESVLERTHTRSRLIIVDNDSKDERVRKYLSGVKGNAKVAVEKIFSESNEGFAPGMNKGMRLSNAPYVCLLNNDCEVTDGWLSEMISISGAREDIGLVNPQSNTFGSCPDKGASANEHAFLIREKKGRMVELGHAIGFACLIKREVIDNIGYLDEAYLGVCYEDTDYSARAREAGYISVLAEGAYVYHVEQASRKGLKGKKDIYRANRKIFEDRWGALLRVLYVDAESERVKDVLDMYNRLKGLARQRAIVEMWVKGYLQEGEEDLCFDGRKSIKHADIGIRRYEPLGGGVKVLWRVLTKKKKFDAIVLNAGATSSVLNFLKPFHGADIFLIEGSSRVRTVSDMLFDIQDASALALYIRGK